MNVSAMSNNALVAEVQLRADARPEGDALRERFRALIRRVGSPITDEERFDRRIATIRGAAEIEPILQERSEQMLGDVRGDLVTLLFELNPDALHAHLEATVGTLPEDDPSRAAWQALDTRVMDEVRRLAAASQKPVSEDDVRAYLQQACRALHPQLLALRRKLLLAPGASNTPSA
jgi:hypothetical protein